MTSLTTEIQFVERLAAPWSRFAAGPVLLAAVALLLALLTVATYRTQSGLRPGRLLAALLLRLGALAVLLLTAVRPSVGITEEPKEPSHLLIGVDLSESMATRDEANNTARIDAVRRALERAAPTLEALKTEQNVETTFYGFGPADFSPAGVTYDPAAPAAAQKSDYGAYLARTLEKWRSERLIRGHIVIGDGADNGQGESALALAGRWRDAAPLHAVVAGNPGTPPNARDVGFSSVAADPSPVPIKNTLALKCVVNAFGFVGATVPVKVQFDTGDGRGYVDVATERATLTKERGNEVAVPLKAPDKPGEVKVRVEIPLESVPGDVAPQNNVVETYLTVTKEGLRVLLVNRLSLEQAALRRALAADKRIDLYEVIRQTDEPPTPGERELFDFDDKAYDVVIVGNVSGRQWRTLDPKLPAALRDQVLKKGVGLLFLGGFAAFGGTPGVPGATGWADVPEFQEVSPVDLSRPQALDDRAFTKPDARFQYLPTKRAAGEYLNKIADTSDAALALWRRLNDPSSRSRFVGLSRIGTPKPAATVYAVASDDAAARAVPAPDAEADAGKFPWLLVGHQIGEGSRGRVLAFAGQDTYLWQRLGLPKSRDGIEAHGRFWRQLVYWLAHQEEDEGAAYARPEFRRLPVRGNQTVRVGLRRPGGAAALDPRFEVRILAPGEAESSAQPRPVAPDPAGGFRVPYEPRLPGEYVVKLKATGRAADGKEVAGEASARFLAFPEASDEALSTAAQPEFLRSLASAGGGEFRRVDELPALLSELRANPPDRIKPKPRYLPDWRRNHSGAFLPLWLLLFAALLAAEWGLRRKWGMV